MEEEKSEKGEKINELLEFLKKEKEENEIRSIKNSLRHEDLIYFTFLLAITALLLTLLFGLDKILDKDSVKIALPFIVSLIVPIFIFLFTRFIGVVFESQFLRYISLHGLFAFFILYFLFAPFISDIGSVSSSFRSVLLDFRSVFLDSRPASSDPRSVLIVVCFIGLILLMILVFPLINNFIKKNILATEKYKELESHMTRLEKILVPFYVGTFVFSISIYFFFHCFIKNEIDIGAIVVLFILFLYSFFLLWSLWKKANK